MKIAYDAKRFFHNTSGLGNYSRDLVRILSQFYPQNEYFLLAKNSSERGKAILEKPEVHFKKISSGIFSRQVKMGIDAQNIGADIFHGLSGELPMCWSGKALKKIVTIHDLIFLRYPKLYSFFDVKIHYWKFKKAAQEADIVIAISEQTKADIIHFLKIPEHKIRVVYQGCHSAFKEKPTTHQLDYIKHKYQLPERFILNVGTIEERKNVLNVVKALQQTNIPLVLVGKTTAYYEKIKKQSIALGVTVLHLHGVSMEDLALIYRLADIFIYPSLFEGFGIPVIEALFSSTCVITSNTSSLPEAGGPNSLYINPLNIDDIRAKILFLWENPSERERRAEKGLKYAQRFDDKVIAQHLMDVYQAVI